MQIQNLDFSETIQHSIRGGLVVNSVTILVRTTSLSSARALAIFGDAKAFAIAKNDIGFLPS